MLNIDIIYDTLYKNKAYEQFNPAAAKNPLIDYGEQAIEFEYYGKHYVIKLYSED